MGPPLEHSVVTSGWGEDRSYRGGRHEGVDVRADVGTPVFSVAPGTVAAVMDMGDRPGGRILVLNHGRVSSWYMHLDKFLVAKGDVVRRGDTIALSGSTATKSPHLHFGITIDPELLPQWRRLFGEPASGFGREKSDGRVPVPVESVLLGLQYTEHALANAHSEGIPIRTLA
jgi:murein DD-endopeptidase MepM/ murein hydrolase activator NlpD